LTAIGGYVAMAVTSALTAPVALLMVRNVLVERLGWEQAGQWQAVWKISEVYLSVLTVALSTYFLPKLATLDSSESILKEIKATARIVMPIVVILAVFVFLLRDLAIDLIFTEAFRPARDLFSIQLIGDVLKILSWLYAYPMLSRGATKWFIGAEVVFSASFVVLVYFLVPKYGVQGANIAYTLNYFAYFIFAYVNVKRFSR